MAESRFQLAQGDAVAWLRTLPASSVDLVLRKPFRMLSCNHVDPVSFRHETTGEVDRVVLHAPDPVDRDNTRDDADAHRATVEEASD